MMDVRHMCVLDRTGAGTIKDPHVAGRAGVECGGGAVDRQVRHGDARRSVHEEDCGDREAREEAARVGGKNGKGLNYGEGSTVPLEREWLGDEHLLVVCLRA